MHSPIPGGFLVAIEGIDGAGKTTQSAILAEACRRRHLSYLISHEPTNGPHGHRLRESAQRGRLSLAEELDLFVNDRREHVEQLINPALAQGKVVILDRYYFSTAAYQGARGANVDEIIQRNEAFAPVPDLLVFMDVPCDLGLDRVHARGDKPNAFEKRDVLCRAKEIFEGLERPYRLKVDATLPVERVSELILAHFMLAAANKLATRDCSPEGVNRMLQLFGFDRLPWTAEQTARR